MITLAISTDLYEIDLLIKNNIALNNKNYFQKEFHDYKEYYDLDIIKGLHNGLNQHLCYLNQIVFEDPNMNYHLATGASEGETLYLTSHESGGWIVKTKNQK